MQVMLADISRVLRHNDNPMPLEIVEHAQRRMEQLRRNDPALKDEYHRGAHFAYRDTLLVIRRFIADERIDLLLNEGTRNESPQSRNGESAIQDPIPPND